MSKKKKAGKKNRASKAHYGTTLWIHIPQSEARRGRRTGWIRIMPFRFRSKRGGVVIEPPRDGDGFEAILMECLPPRKKLKKADIDCYYHPSKTGCEKHGDMIDPDSCPTECYCPIEEGDENGTWRACNPAKRSGKKGCKKKKGAKKKQ